MSISIALLIDSWSSATSKCASLIPFKATPLDQLMIIIRIMWWFENKLNALHFPSFLNTFTRDSYKDHPIRISMTLFVGLKMSHCAFLCFEPYLHSVQSSIYLYLQENFHRNQMRQITVYTGSHPIEWTCSTKNCQHGWHNLPVTCKFISIVLGISSNLSCRYTPHASHGLSCRRRNTCCSSKIQALATWWQPRL